MCLRLGADSADSRSDDFFGVQHVTDCHKLIRVNFETVSSFSRREEIQITIIEGTKFHSPLNGAVRIPQQNGVTAEHARRVSVWSVLECKVFTVVCQVVHDALPRYRKILSAFYPDSPCFDRDRTVTGEADQLGGWWPCFGAMYNG